MWQLFDTASYNQTLKKIYLQRVLTGHNVQVGCIVFHPQATLTQENTGICMATCAYDGSVKLWSLERLAFSRTTAFKSLQYYRLSTVT
jgi:WD40 repeat protein